MMFDDCKSRPLRAIGSTFCHWIAAEFRNLLKKILPWLHSSGPLTCATSSVSVSPQANEGKQGVTNNASPQLLFPFDRWTVCAQIELGFNCTVALQIYLLHRFSLQVYEILKWNSLLLSSFLLYRNRKETLDHWKCGAHYHFSLP